METLISAFVSILPILILVGILFYYMHRMGNVGDFQKRFLAAYLEHVELQREMNLQLQRIVEIAADGPASRRDDASRPDQPIV